MRKSLLEKLACPFDKQDLVLRIYKEDGDSIQEGLFTCLHCERYFPIIYGIPIMAPDDYREKKLEAPFLEKWGERIIESHATTKFALAPKEEALM